MFFKITSKVGDICNSVEYILKHKHRMTIRNILKISGNGTNDIHFGMRRKRRNTKQYWLVVKQVKLSLIHSFTELLNLNFYVQRKTEIIKEQHSYIVTYYISRFMTLSISWFWLNT